VTRPFDFEGMVRKNQADQGIDELRNHVDTLLAIPNDRLFDIIDEKTTSIEAFRVADNVLRQAVQAITDVITRHGLINVDFADVRSIMSGAGEALMGMGESRGAGRALDAAKTAIQSPLLENVTIDGAKGPVGQHQREQVHHVVRSQNGHGLSLKTPPVPTPMFFMGKCSTTGWKTGSW
jgi:cell division protein FtsZ